MTEFDAMVKPAQVVVRRLDDDGAIPNHPELPLLVYRRAVTLPDGDPAAVFEALFTANGWPAAWRNGIFPFHHFHSTAHSLRTADVKLYGLEGPASDYNLRSPAVLGFNQVVRHHRPDETEDKRPADFAAQEKRQADPLSMPPSLQRAASSRSCSASAPVDPHPGFQDTECEADLTPGKPALS